MKVEIILSIVVAGCTIIYTLINYFTLIESVRNRKQKIDPLIIGFLKSSENHMTLSLHIKNVGEGIAKNVRINVLKDYKQFGREDMLISKIGIFKNGLNIFPANYELTFHLNQMTKLNHEQSDSFVEIEIQYQRIDNKKLKQKYRLPFNQIIGQTYTNPPENYIGQIPYYLNEINKTMKKNN